MEFLQGFIQKIMQKFLESFLLFYFLQRFLKELIWNFPNIPLCISPEISLASPLKGIFLWFFFMKFFLAICPRIFFTGIPPEISKETFSKVYYRSSFSCFFRYSERNSFRTSSNVCSRTTLRKSSVNLTKRFLQVSPK